MIIYDWIAIVGYGKHGPGKYDEREETETMVTRAVSNCFVTRSSSVVRMFAKLRIL